MRLHVHQRIDYLFSEPQARLVQLLRTTPLSHGAQSVVEWRVDVDRDARLKSGRDGFGNETAMLYVDGPIERVSLLVTGEVLTDDRAGMVHGTAETLPPAFYLQSTRLTAANEEIAAFVRDAAGSASDPLDRAHRIKDALHERVSIDPTGAAPLADAASAFRDGASAYQDVAQLFVAAARTAGLPARYVSGFRLPDEGADDAAHGWAEAFLPDYGWIGFDAAHARCPDEAYVRVAVGLDRRDAAPVSGSRTGGGQEWLDASARMSLAPHPR